MSLPKMVAWMLVAATVASAPLCYDAAPMDVASTMETQANDPQQKPLSWTAARELIVETMKNAGYSTKTVNGEVGKANGELTSGWVHLCLSHGQEVQYPCNLDKGCTK